MESATTLLLVFWIFSFLTNETEALSPPSYISEWVLMDSDDPATTFRTFNHGFGVRPVKVEVQVMSPTTSFIYPGVKSAFAGNDDNERGGVIAIYNENEVRLYGATNAGTELGNAYIINTGIASWTSDNQEQSTTGHVRVRAWHPGDLPTPSYTTTLNMKAGNYIWNDYEERSHGLGSVPELTVVQYTPAWTVSLTGWVSEGQGSSSRPTNNPNLYWGGLVYGVDSQDIRLWAPSSGQANYGIFSFCDGWGYDVRGDDCSYVRASVTITMWTDLSATESYSHTELHEASGTHEFSLFPTHSINVDDDIVTVAALATDGTNNGYQFYGTGAAMVDNAEGCGGLVYAYSNVTSALRIWHPVGGSSNIIHLEGMGGGTYNQVSNQAIIAIRLFKVSNSVIDYCTGVSIDAGVNTDTTLTSLADGCMATYTCHSGYNHISGNLERIYKYSLNTWNGTAPQCQVLCSRPTSGISSVYSLSSSQVLIGILATYTCIEGTEHTSGDQTRVCYGNGSWTGSSLVCTASPVTTTVTTTSPPLVTTTTTETPSSTETGSVCFNLTTVVNVTSVMRIADEIVANLTVPANTTSKYLRRLISAPDDRTSSTVIGMAGAVICVITMGLLFIPDTITALSFLISKIRKAP